MSLRNKMWQTAIIMFGKSYGYLDTISANELWVGQDSYLSRLVDVKEYQEKGDCVDGDA